MHPKNENRLINIMNKVYTKKSCFYIKKKHLYPEKSTIMTNYLKIRCFSLLVNFIVGNNINELTTSFISKRST